MDQKLTKSQILKLIKLYRSHALLWDTNSRDYRRNDLKTKAYNYIASEMGLPADIIKKKMRSLRSTYTSEKRKIYMNKISGTESYVPTLSWFNEMSFLDNTIITKYCDSSKEDSCNSRIFEVFEEVECDNYFSNEKPNKRPKKERSKSRESPEKVNNIKDKDNEYTSFATSISYQLQKLPEEEAYKLMAEVQNLLTQRKLKYLRSQRCLSSCSNDSS